MDENRLRNIFKKNKNNSTLIGTPEGFSVEYKESFSWGGIADYAKAMVSMANNRGGHIIFGVKDKPHTLIGLVDNKLNKFLEKDVSLWSKYMRETFEPSLLFEKGTYEYEGKTYGVIEVQESVNKPVICKKYVEGKLRKGAIYYRYIGENTEIEFPELKKIIDDEKRKANELWMQKIKQISAAGVANSMIVNTKDGIIEGKNGPLYIEEELLNQIRFVDQGKFVENDGEPVLSLIGNVTCVSNVPFKIGTKSKEVAITENRIVERVLLEEEVETPEEYLKKIVTASSKNYPIYYYLKLLEISTGNENDYFKNMVGQKSNMDEIFKRIIRKGCYYSISLKDTGTIAYRGKKVWRDAIINEQNMNEGTNELRYFFEAVRSLDKSEIYEHKKYIQEKMKYIYENYYQIHNTAFRSEFRKALCYIDEVLYVE